MFALRLLSNMQRDSIIKQTSSLILYNAHNNQSGMSRRKQRWERPGTRVSMLNLVLISHAALLSVLVTATQRTQNGGIGALTQFNFQFKRVHFQPKQ